MIGRFIALFITALVLNTSVLSAGNTANSAGTSSREETASGVSEGVNKARDLVLNYFTPFSGTVAGVEDGRVKVRFEGEGDVKKGMRFSVLREGKVFYHPVTNEPIGKTEEFIGRIEAEKREALDGSYICKIVKGDIKVGDVVRITSSRIKLAFFQDRKSDWNLSEAFFASLKESGRFEILESYTPSYDPEDLSRLARKLNAEAVLMLSTPVKDGKKHLNVQLFWTEDAKSFGEIEEVTGPDIIGMLTPDEEFISATLTDTEPWGSYNLKGGHLLAMGDVDSNGVNELVLSDGNNIIIYSLENELREQWTIKGGNYEKHLSIDIFDVNNNGAAEIFVTSLTDRSEIRTDESMIAIENSEESKVQSYVIEYDTSQGYRKIKDDMPYFLRISGKTLLMQKFSPIKIFSGPVFEGEWRDNGYHPKRPLNVSEDVNIYGFTYIDWQNMGQRYLATFDNNGYLKLYDDRANLIWKSKKTYGRFEQSFERETHSVANPTISWSVRGRLIPVQTERGQEIVVINKNPMIQQVPGLGIKGADVYSLWWDGGVMDEKLILNNISGNITDFWIEGRKLFLIARGDMLSFVKNAITGEFTKGSILYYYVFSEK